MLESVRIDLTGHYIIDLPIKENATLPNNKAQVIHTFESLLKRLKNYQRLFSDYNSFI